MKKDITKALIEKSTIHTSEDFTDRLLLKIKEEHTEHITHAPQLQSLWYPVAALILGGGIFFGAVLLDILPQFQVFKIQVQLNRTFFLILLSITLLLGANHLWRLQHTFTNSTKGL